MTYKQQECGGEESLIWRAPLDAWWSLHPYGRARAEAKQQVCISKGCFPSERTEELGRHQAEQQRSNWRLRMVTTVGVLRHTQEVAWPDIQGKRAKQSTLLGFSGISRMLVPRNICLGFVYKIEVRYLSPGIANHRDSEMISHFCF